VGLLTWIKRFDADQTLEAMVALLKR